MFPSPHGDKFQLFDSEESLRGYLVSVPSRG